MCFFLIHAFMYLGLLIFVSYFACFVLDYGILLLKIEIS